MSMAFLLPALLLLLLAAAAATDEGRLTVKPGCQARCGSVDIPYPFGIGTGCFRKGFEISCNNNNGSAGASPVLAGTSLRVEHLSVNPAESQVMLPMGWQCYNATQTRNTNFNWSDGTTEMNRDGVYRISNTHNMLVVLGCNSVGFTKSKRTEGGTESYAHFVGCMSYCNNSASAQDGHCAGVGCCHVDIPPGLTDNSFSFREYDHSAMLDYSPCDYAFLVDRNKYTFKRSDLFMDRNGTSPVWLDWAIRENGSMTCADAAKMTTEYACKSGHSYCVNSINGPGYTCNCSDGYQGNPYLVGGCTDINECENPAKYPCNGVCKNIPASYECSCRSGDQSDDPKTQRCTPKFPLAARIAIGAIAGILVLAFLSFIFFLRKEKRKTKEFYRKNGGPTLEKAKIIKLFKKEELKPILKVSNIIGKGGFGEVYKGLVDNALVAIKKPIGGNVLEDEQFANEVIIQSQVIHKNIVRLIGCCLEVDTPMLVYEFLPKGSLDDILHSENRAVPLNLNVRLSIAAESAHGLAYMHSQAHTRILHGDVKPANILLDDNLAPKISDFGISKLIARDKQIAESVIGDKSYMDPVYLQTGLLTEKSDVYSFGVVILELISRRKATHSDNNSLVRNFLQDHKKGKKATELFDKEIAAIEDLELLDSLAGMAVECLNLDVDERPSMTDIAERLLILNRSRKL